MAKPSRSERKAGQRVHPLVEQEQVARDEVLKAYPSDARLWEMVGRAIEVFRAEAPAQALRFRMNRRVSDGAVIDASIGWVPFSEEWWDRITTAERDRTLAVIRLRWPQLNQYVVVENDEDPLWDLLTWHKDGDPSAPRPQFPYRLMNGNPAIFYPDGRMLIPEHANDAEAEKAVAFRKALKGISLGGHPSEYGSDEEFEQVMLGAIKAFKDQKEVWPTSKEVAFRLWSLSRVDVNEKMKRLTKHHNRSWTFLLAKAKSEEVDTP